jgi:Predicted membrane protein
MKYFFIDLMIRFNKDDLSAIASQLAYSLILAFFPFLIFLITLIGYTHISETELLSLFHSILPENAFNLINNTTIELLTTKHPSLLSISLLLILWSASSGFNAVIKGLNKAYSLKESRNFFMLQFISILGTVAITFIILIMVFLLVFSKIIWLYVTYKFNWLNHVITMLIIIRYVIVVSLGIFTFSALYRYGPSKKLTWEEVCYGSIFSTFSIIIVSSIFSYYVNNFSSYSVIYGSIGAIIVLLLWLYIISLIILLGGEINALSLLYNKNPHST